MSSVIGFWRQRRSRQGPLSAGGAPTPVTELAPGEVSHCWPQVLPGGGAVLFTVLTSMAGVDGASIEAFSLKDRRRKTILRGGTWSRYLPSGHLVYVNDGTLFAAAFDLDRMQVRSTSVPILADVAYDTETGLAKIDFSGTSSGSGTVVYSSGRVGAAMVTVQWLDGFGKTRPLLPKPGAYRYPRLSPDGNRVAFSSGGDIWVFEWQRETMTRLTFDGSHTHPIGVPTASTSCSGGGKACSGRVLMERPSHSR